MNQTATAEAWSPSTPHDPMTSAVIEDFTSFLDMADFSVSFPSLDCISAQDDQPVHEGVAERMDTGPDASNDLLGRIQTDIHHQQDHSIQQEQHHSLLSGLGQLQDSADALFGINMQTQFSQQQQRQHQQQMQEHVYQGQYMIPPTPNSIEMTGGAARYYQQVDAQAQALHYQRLKEDQMIFTPLVSPAVTPLEANFALPEYTIPGAYLSPLTSPALEAQPSISHRVNYHKASRSDTSIASSPLDVLDLTLVNTSSTTSQPGSAKRARRTSVANRNPARVVRQSPSMKPQRRKPTANATLSNKDLMEHVLDAQSQSNGANIVQATPGTLSIPRGRDTSESDSISPEPLSEALMPPPPPPRSVAGRESPTTMVGTKGGDSIALAAREADANGSNSDLHPATPASLMRLQKQPPPRTNDARRSPLTLDVSASAGQGSTEKTVETHGTTENLMPSNSKDGSGANTNDVNQVTPTIPERKPQTGKPSSTPTSAVSTGDDRSPVPKGITSPHVVASGKKSDGKVSGRAGTKRATSSSVHVSPALRPKISPSIKPLLPEGVTLSAEASALLLASKSNYQNILEGNHLPGVSYPETLSTNLTSKRTSHKIAEQGRRNRINQALQEIASLLPPSMGRDAPGNGGEGGGNNQVGQQLSNSKASTVEMAIEYIKTLQRDLSETKGKLEAAEKKLEKKS